MKAFLELWSARPEWLALSREERAKYMQGIGPAIQTLQDAGVEIVGWGILDPQTSHRAGYDFWGIYRMRDQEQVRMFEQAVQEAGWYDYFEQVNASGELHDPQTVIGQLIEL